MGDLPQVIDILEEGPREGFQIEKGFIEETGIRTGIDLEALVEVGRLAERIVGRQLPSAMLRSGTLAPFRKAA